MNTTDGNYHDGFNAGLRVAVDLTRAGASPDDLALLLPVDPGQIDPREYQDELSELRKALGTDAIIAESRR